MSIFSNKKIKLSKTCQGERMLYCIDYAKCKETNTFLQAFFSEYVAQANTLMVKDSELFYEKNPNDLIHIFAQIKENLGQLGLVYQEDTEKKEEDNHILGVRVGNAKLITHYRFGVMLEQSKITELIDIISRFNILCYCSKKNTDVHELFNLYQTSKGYAHELEDAGYTRLYHDCFFKRISILSEQDLTEKLEHILSIYHNK